MVVGYSSHRKQTHANSILMAWGGGGGGRGGSRGTLLRRSDLRYRKGEISKLPQARTDCFKNGPSPNYPVRR